MKISSDGITVQRPISAAVPDLYNKKKMPKKLHRESSARPKVKSTQIDSKAVMGETGKHFGESEIDNYKNATSYTQTNQVKSMKINEKKTIFSHETIPLEEVEREVNPSK
jgi:hypothetical protein